MSHHRRFSILSLLALIAMVAVALGFYRQRQALHDATLQLNAARQQIQSAQAMHRQHLKREFGGAYPQPVLAMELKQLPVEVMPKYYSLFPNLYGPQGQNVTVGAPTRSIANYGWSAKFLRTVDGKDAYQLRYSTSEKINVQSGKTPAANERSLLFTFNGTPQVIVNEDIVAVVIAPTIAQAETALLNLYEPEQAVQKLESWNRSGSHRHLIHTFIPNR